MNHKPHRTYEEQLDLLLTRGVVCGDRARALEILQSVGYYHFGAYVYPFRELLPEDERCLGSSVQFRADRVRPGTRFEDIVSIWQFDRRLRLHTLSALETVERSLRTRMAYTLGRREKFGHLDRAALNPTACRKPPRSRAGRRSQVKDAFDDWRSRYEDLKGQAKNEDFVKHHREKYGDRLPVWVAVEFFDFGSLGRLYELMLGSDQNEVAATYGLQGNVLKGWITQLNYVRNLCAHHSRVWNRELTLRVPAPTAVPRQLSHLGSVPLRRIYAPLAILGYLVATVGTEENWRAETRTLMQGFPGAGGLTIERDMGFPDQWMSLDLWR